MKCVACGRDRQRVLTGCVWRKWNPSSALSICVHPLLKLFAPAVIIQSVILPHAPAWNAHHLFGGGRTTEPPNPLGRRQSTGSVRRLQNTADGLGSLPGPGACARGGGGSGG